MDPVDDRIVRWEPERWYVCFRETSDYRWLNWLPGRFHHVSAFGYVPVVEVWIFVDYTGARLFVEAVPDGPMALKRMDQAMKGCTVLDVPRGNGTRFAWRPLTSCVSTIAAIIGIRCCALLPDGLYRNCLAFGGTVFEGARDDENSEAGPGARG